MRRVLDDLKSGRDASPEATLAALDILEQYECWTPFFKLVKRLTDNPGQRQLQYYVRLARVQNLYLEDVFAAAEAAARLVADMSVSFKELTDDLLPQFIAFEDFAAEATILSAVVDGFRSPVDRVSCLERLCMLYEKKTHNEELLGESYKRLLDADPKNVKALRYFKLVFTQGNEWERVVAVLQTLLEGLTHPLELYRTGQELAAIYLYQLGMAEEAIQVIDTHCAGSPLDTSTILYDAYHRIGNWTGCLTILQALLATVSTDRERSVLHFKMAALEEQAGHLQIALDHYVTSVKLWPECLDGIGAIINLGVQRRDWALVKTWLSTLGSQVRDERLRAQLKQAQIRLQDGLAHGSRTPP